MGELAEGIRGPALVDLVRDEGWLGARGDQVGGDSKGLGRDVGVAERAGIHVDRREEVGRDAGLDRQPECDDQRVDHLARRGGSGIDPVQGAVAAVVRVVIDVDDGPGMSARAVDQPLGPVRVRAVGQHRHVKHAIDPGQLLVPVGAGQERQYLRHRVRAAVHYRPSGVLERAPQRQERSQHVGVGMDMAEHEGAPRTPPERGEHILWDTRFGTRADRVGPRLGRTSAGTRTTHA